MEYSMDENALAAYDIARKTARLYKNEVTGTEHLLYGILKVDCCASKIFLANRFNPDGLNVLFEEETSGSGNVEPQDSVRLSESIPFEAYGIAAQLGASQISPDHLMLAILEDRNCFAVDALYRLYNVNSAAYRRAIFKLLQGAQPQRPDNQMFVSGVFGMPNGYGSDYFSGTNSHGMNGGIKNNAHALPSQLADLGVDVTAKAMQNKLDPVIGREQEVARLIEILCRKTKNNPVLIGEPGVGKSAIIDGLAKAIVDGKVPRQLQNNIIFSLNIGSLMAGTKYRGQLEEKLKSAIDLIINSGNIIVFIDELHTLMQAGSKDGEVTPADILKPYLARGEMQTIGATTTDEYRKYIEADKAMERRFQPIIVEPPTVDQTIEILKGLRSNYENFHKVKLSDAAIVAAARLSDKYIADRFLPDKAIDLIDEAMSCAKVGASSAPADFTEMNAQLAEYKKKMQEAAARQDYAEADKCKRKAEELENTIKQRSLQNSAQQEKITKTISEEDIADVVSRWTKIPVSKLTETETTRLQNLEALLHKRVIGQNRAVEAVAKAIRRARAGLKSDNRPIGSFIFLGPTGVGKTELTKALAEAMFDNENSIIRLDMSEFMEAHSVSKLIGAPPGYVGFDDGGQLTERVRRHPYSVVLFDEIEKAHPDVFNALLQILDDGRLTDSQGRTVSFKNTLIIMTSNVGATAAASKREIGFNAVGKSENSVRDETYMNALKNMFRPEFLNRIDVTCVFDKLTKDDVAQIADIMLNKVKKSLMDKNISLDITPAALNRLIEMGYDAEYGARPLRRVIEQNVEDEIAEAIICGKVTNNSSVRIDCVNDKIVIV
ncbi:MAG: ATP-dependent Clp protease ATP-binding subunit [Clostridiales bacterium]|nr:ATP-dependent Clp protease ATP-binding subunit [Clostridiales bacterium]